MVLNQPLMIAELDVPVMLDTAQKLVVMYGLRIVAALIILLLGMWLAKLVKSFVEKVMRKRNLDPTLISFVGSLLLVAMKIFVIVAALEKLNIKTTSFIAILGAAGLAVGLALQGSLSNFASGVLMIIFKPFKIGDFIEAGGVMGSVLEISIFTTIMKSPDNKKIIVPNSSVMGGTITNFNANNTRRIDLLVSIGYNDDIDKAKAVIWSILEADDRVLKDPKPLVVVKEMAESSVNILVRPWAISSNYWSVLFDTTEAVKKRFDQEGITIPFPQRDVHLYEHKAVAAISDRGEDGRMGVEA